MQDMRAHLDDIDFDLAEKKEAEFRHDVMAHVHTFGVAGAHLHLLVFRCIRLTKVHCSHYSSESDAHYSFGGHQLLRGR